MCDAVDNIYATHPNVGMILNNDKLNRADFFNFYVRKNSSHVDWFLFLPSKQINISCQKILEELSTIDDVGAVYYSHFVQKNDLKIPIIYPTYNRELITSGRLIINPPIAIQANVLNGVKFTSGIQYLNMYDILLKLSKICMIGRSTVMLDSIIPYDVENREVLEKDIKLINEQRR